MEKREESLDFKKLLESRDIDIELLKRVLKSNSSDFMSNLEQTLVLGNRDISLVNKLNDNIQRYSKFIIETVSRFVFKMPIHLAIASKKQSEIKSVFYNIAERLGFDDGLQAQIDQDLEEIANEMNRRFTFDEMSLVHLIEASKASNIQLEEISQRRSNNIRQIVKQKQDGEIILSAVPSSGPATYTSGKPIPTKTVDGFTVIAPDESKNIILSAYPDAKRIMETVPQDEIMKQIIKTLLENLELCVEMYRLFYTKNPDKPLEESIPFTVESKEPLRNPHNLVLGNTARTVSGETFKFYFIINSWNLPHLLGIQQGAYISEAVKNYFAEVGEDGKIVYPITETSSAFTILLTILKNKERIIKDGGLIEENGKKYQLFPWEKIILKTSSFMRGDFFKKCFCLVKLREGGITSSKEKLATISSTMYSGDMTSSSYTVSSVVNDLLNTKKQKKDFIFRTFMPYENGIYIPVSIVTGKGETIVTKNKEKIKTLDRLRYSIDEEAGGEAIESIENENMGKVSFGPIDQALLGFSIEDMFGFPVRVSGKASEFESSLRDLLDSMLGKDLDDLFPRGPRLTKK